MATESYDICPLCKEEVKRGASICKHCGCNIWQNSLEHEGTCPYCKESINQEAVRCKHCKSNLISSPYSQCGCNASDDYFPTWKTKNPPNHEVLVFSDKSVISDILDQPGSSDVITSKLKRIHKSSIQKPFLAGYNIIVFLPRGICMGRYKCVTICLPYIGCHGFCYWECELV